MFFIHQPYNPAGTAAVKASKESGCNCALAVSSLPLDNEGRLHYNLAGAFGGESCLWLLNILGSGCPRSATKPASAGLLLYGNTFNP
jgi:hypothetical protein